MTPSVEILEARDCWVTFGLRSGILRVYLSPGGERVLFADRGPKLLLVGGGPVGSFRRPTRFKPSVLVT